MNDLKWYYKLSITESSICDRECGSCPQRNRREDITYWLLLCIGGYYRNRYVSLALTIRGFVETSLPVRIWDIVGEDQALKGEYKVIAGRVYVPYVSYHLYLL